MVNIRDKKCIACNKIPTYNVIGSKTGLYCMEHKLEGMIDVRHQKCAFDKCKTRPIYNYPTEIKPLYCNLHKKDNMINIVDNKCRIADRKCFAFSILQPSIGIKTLFLFLLLF